MRIAIIGSGISGLTVAHQLYQQHDITVFEAQSHVGGHVHTHDVTVDGKQYAIDSGFIVFNHQTYPQYTKLLDELEVSSQATDMSFAVSCAKSGIEYQGSSLNGLFANRRNLVNPAFWGMLNEIRRFNQQSVQLLKDDSNEICLGDYLTQQKYSTLFRDYYILPMGAAIWSTAPELMLGFPARFFIRFFRNHGLLSVRNRPIWQVIQSGSRAYVERMIAPFAKSILLNTPVKKVLYNNSGVTIEHAKGTQHFDAVFMACHTDQALALLDNPTTAQSEVLQAIPYQRNDAVLHTDNRLLPKRQHAQAAWNYLMPNGPGGKVCLTYNMNILQGINCDQTFCVTLNANEHIRPEYVIKTMHYSHPLFTLGGEQAKSRQREINGAGNTYFCGAWWRNGFHEDGVVSAQQAVQHFQQDNALRFASAS